MKRIHHLFLWATCGSLLRDSSECWAAEDEGKYVKLTCLHSFSLWLEVTSEPWAGSRPMLITFWACGFSGLYKPGTRNQKRLNFYGACADFSGSTGANFKKAMFMYDINIYSHEISGEYLHKSDDWRHFYGEMINGRLKQTHTDLMSFNLYHSSNLVEINSD